jgi:hypothetical protein
MSGCHWLNLSSIAAWFVVEPHPNWRWCPLVSCTSTWFWNHLKSIAWVDFPEGCDKQLETTVWYCPFQVVDDGLKAAKRLHSGWCHAHLQIPSLIPFLTKVQLSAWGSCSTQKTLGVDWEMHLSLTVSTRFAIVKKVFTKQKNTTGPIQQGLRPSS